MNKPRKSFRDQLKDLYFDTLKMGGSLTEMIEKTRLAFSALDQRMADEIIDMDDVIDESFRNLEDQSIELIACQAPVAIDLRRIIAMMRIGEHIERMADLCVNIAKIIRDLQGSEVSPWMKETLDKMAIGANRMVELAMDSFKEKDTEAAARLAKDDDAIDKLNRSFFKRMDEVKSGDVDVFIRIIMVSRFLERIADHAVDISEEVHYMVKKEFV